MNMPTFLSSRPRHVLVVLAAALLPACSGAESSSPDDEPSAVLDDDQSDPGTAFQLRGGIWAPDPTAIAPSSNGDAGSDAAPGSDGCETETTIVWFPDADGDGFGVTSGGLRACSKPPGLWATAGGDCADDDARVHPAQRVYFPDPYLNANGEPTFDYDCNGYEDSDPRMPGGAPQCGVLSVDACGGSGYLATARYGEGVNVLCGSKSTLTCKPNTLGLLCGPLHANVDAAHRCH